MVRVFISYRRADAKEEVQRLSRRLERRYGRASVFTDVVDIDHGEDFLEAIRSSLARGDVILVVIGPRWVPLLHERARNGELQKDYTSIEVKIALDNAMRVIPVLVGGATMPDQKQLPTKIRELALRNGVELRPDHWKRDVRRLCRSLDTTLWKVDDRRGYSPWQLSFPAALYGLFAWSVAILLAVPILVRRGEIYPWEWPGGHWVSIPALLAVVGGVASGTIVGLVHTYLLRGTRIVIKKEVWRKLVRTWAGLSALGPVAILAAMPSSDQRLGLLFLAPFVIGAGLGLTVARKLRRSDRNIRKRALLAAAGSWAGGFVVSLLLAWGLFNQVQAEENRIAAPPTPTPAWPPDWWPPKALEPLVGKKEPTDVVGLGVAEARDLLEAEGFEVHVSYGSLEGDPDVVAEQRLRPKTTHHGHTHGPTVVLVVPILEMEVVQLPGPEEEHVLHPGQTIDHEAGTGRATITLGLDGPLGAQGTVVISAGGSADASRTYTLDTGEMRTPRLPFQASRLDITFQCDEPRCVLKFKLRTP